MNLLSKRLQKRPPTNHQAKLNTPKLNTFSFGISANMQTTIIRVRT